MGKRRIGLLIDTFNDLCEYQLCRGILKYFSSLGVQVILFEVANNFRKVDFSSHYGKVIEMVRKSEIDGLIVFSTFFLDQMSRESLVRLVRMFQPLPLLSIGVEIPDIPSIHMDEEQSLRDLVDHLVLDRNMTQFRFIFGPESNDYFGKRLGIIRKRFVEHGIVISDDMILHVDNIDLFDAKVETRQLLAKSMLMPEAIICYDDYTALNVIEYFENKGINIPEDLLVTGFDDIPTASPYKIKLLTVHQPLYYMGVESARLISHIVEGNPVEIKTLIQTTLVRNDVFKLFRRMEDRGGSQKIHNLQSVEDLRRAMHDIILSVSSDDCKGRRVIFNIIDLIEDMAIMEYPKDIRHCIIRIFSSSETDSRIFSEMRYILCNGLEYLYRHYGSGSPLYGIFSSALNAVDDYLFSSLIYEGQKRDERNWRISVEGQAVLKCDSLENLLKSLPDFLNRYDVENFLLFLYDRDISTLPDDFEDLPTRTSLAFIKSANAGITDACSLSFDTQDILPDWKILLDEASYIFIMLFYGNAPVGYMFIDYNEEIDPKTYLAIRSNLETALCNAIRFESERYQADLNSGYYLNQFQNLRTTIFNPHIPFKRIESDKTTASALERLDVSLYSYKNSMSHLFTFHGEMHSFNFSTVLNGSDAVKRYCRHLCLSGSVESCISEGICFRFDPFALYLILNLLGHVSHISLYLDKEVYLEIDLSSSTTGLDQWGAEGSPGDVNPKPVLHIIKDLLSMGNGDFRFLQNGAGPLILRISFTPFSNSFSHPDMGGVSRRVKDFTSESYRKSRIIVISSDRKFGKYAADSLAGQYEVLFASSKEEAYKYDKGGNVDLVLADLPETPQLDFYDDCSDYLGFIIGGAQLLFMSEDNSPNARLWAARLGGVDFLIKPFSLSELTLKLNKYLKIVEYRKNHLFERFERELFTLAANEDFPF